MPDSDDYADEHVLLVLLEGDDYGDADGYEDTDDDADDADETVGILEGF